MSNESSHKLHPDDLVLSQARLGLHLLEDGERFPCFLVLPGGGYEDVVHSEGPPVAAWLNSIGISAVVLDYTVSRGNRNQTIYPAPQQQALYTLRWLRQQAENLNLDESKIGVIGFSAGGHLAACTANGFDREDWLLDPDQTLQTIPARPDACILAYAVLNTQGPFAHRGSMHNLLGNGFANSSISEELNWPERIHSKAPDTFIWHTQEDATVPVENAYRMALRLQEKGIPHEAHVFPKGSHGLGICSLDFRRQGAVEQWRALAERWLREIGF